MGCGYIIVLNVGVGSRLLMPGMSKGILYMGLGGSNVYSFDK